MRTFLLCTLGALALIILPALAYRQYFIWQAERRLAELEAELDRTDPGWRFEEILAARKKIPDEENSAPLVLEVAKLLPEGWPGKPARSLEPSDDAGAAEDEEPLPKRVLRRDPNLVLDHKTANELGRELTALTQVAEKARALKSAPHRGEYRIVHAKNFMGTPLPHLDATRSIGDLLLLDAILRVHNGNSDQALESVCALRIAANSLGDEPFSVSVWIRMRCDHLATASLEYVLAQGGTSDGALAGFQSDYQAEREALAALVVAAMRMDRAAQFQLFGRFANSELSLRSLNDGKDIPPSVDEVFTGWLYIGPRMRHLQTSGTLAMSEGVRIGRLSPEEQHVPIRHWMEAGKIDVRKDKDWEKIAYLLVAGNGKFMLGSLKCRMKLDATLVALACERYRLKHDDWPDIIEDLIPEYLDKVPQDCFRKAPLNFRRLPDGIVIYSVGPDGEDDGGLIIRGERPPPKERGEPANEDIGFRLWSPNARRQPPPAEDRSP